MARYTGAKNRLSRREGQDLFGRGNKLRRATQVPGQHGARRVRRLSNFGTQLREKQKTKRIYGIMERQFHRYFEKAAKFRGSTGERLLQLLELRLDNIVYRMGFAPTRAMARQMVGHAHVLVNGETVSIPSFQVGIGDKISLDPTAAAIPEVAKRLEDRELPVPAWVTRQANVGELTALPQRADVDGNINEQLIVEFYSR